MPASLLITVLGPYTATAYAPSAVVHTFPIHESASIPSRCSAATVFH
ncbi:hypothetical protein N136_00128 [Leifsonia aquatica ATCC 14665]|uniref:Uncharacterized protein n=1 Tax=Leifsonia aquatica ATCC 14665 TaxID=1358026 RepID=U2RE89_LEIAQ|nr:hypothetical protein N136_00128 [Leifsonia aquatica ATCC 14665]